jgi:Na+/proline symporter
MSTLDVIIIVAYFGLTLAIGLAFRRRGGRSLSEYFVSGRALPWWLAGTSMVATTFAADTPLAITGIVAKEGVAGNWVWWAYLPGGLATVFFFAALWRRAEVVTDVELIALRYGGAPARFLRAFRAVYLGVLMNGIIMGWVNAAMAKILSIMLDMDERLALGICLLLTVGYATLAGLWGVVVADLFQFVIGMGGTIALAVVAVKAVGGLDALPDALAAASHPVTGERYDPETLLSLLPTDAPWSIPILTFGVYLFVNWWASWYPSAEPGGGGYVAQRLFATRNERHAVLAGLWFNVAHYALRPWPWIIAGLCGIALYGNTLRGPDGVPDPELNYVQLIVDHMEDGWRGLLLAAFAAAYMSTISTQLNWGASYLVNDLWRPFKKREGSDEVGVAAGRVSTVILLCVALAITPFIDSIGEAWKFLMALGAGTGLVLILRWYWWRVNAWSEIASMTTALATSLVLFSQGGDLTYGETVCITVLVTTVVWLAVTFLTPPESMEKLRGFCNRVRPPGPGWKPVMGGAGEPLHLGVRFLGWGASLLLVYGALFGVGHLLIGSPTYGGVFLGAAALAAVVLWRTLRHPCFGGSLTP